MRRSFDPICPSSDLPIRIGAKWTAMIVLLLEEQPQRFAELQAKLGGISSKVLSETLRSMVDDGLVTRTDLSEVHRRVEYELTPIGRRLLPLIEVVRAWSSEHLEPILAARGISLTTHPEG